RQRRQEKDPDAIPPVVTLSSQLIARWLGTPSYLDTDGQPLPLPRVDSPDAPGISFEALVESVTTDVRPRAVLVDWVSQGLVTLDADERVRLNTAAFIPRPGSTEQIFYFARNLHDHIAAAAARRRLSTAVSTMTGWVRRPLLRWRRRRAKRRSASWSRSTAWLSVWST